MHLIYNAIERRFLKEVTDTLYTGYDWDEDPHEYIWGALLDTREDPETNIVWVLQDVFRKEGV